MWRCGICETVNAADATHCLGCETVQLDATRTIVVASRHLAPGAPSKPPAAARPVRATAKPPTRPPATPLPPLAPASDPGARRWAIPAAAAVVLLLLVVGALAIRSANESSSASDSAFSNSNGQSVDGQSQSSTENRSSGAETFSPESDSSESPPTPAPTPCPSGVADAIRSDLPGTTPQDLEARYEAGNFVIHICSDAGGEIYHGENMSTGDHLVLVASGSASSGYLAVNGAYEYEIDDEVLTIYENGSVLQSNPVTSFDSF